MWPMVSFPELPREFLVFTVAVAFAILATAALFALVRTVARRKAKNKSS
jgi:hypothetical protein